MTNAPLIAVSGLGFTRDGQPMLRDLDLTLNDHDRLAIIGPNGAGKTTLLRLIVGLERPTYGDIRLFGMQCQRESDFRQPRLRIGFLFQDSDDQLFCPIVVEDVAFGPLNAGQPPKVAFETAHKALSDLGIAHLADRPIHKLSGGEKRLVCLAGVLAMAPRVLVLDEPTNGVDRHNQDRLSQALHRFDGAILLVSHDEAFIARHATRLLQMTEGRLSGPDHRP